MNLKNRYRYLIFLLTVLFLFLVFIEIKQPYYFLHDDNISYVLPSISHNYNSIANSQIPFYNFHQHLGTPTFSAGLTATFYPFIYLSVFLSKSFWGHPFAAIDILTIIHLLIGAAGMYFFLNKILNSNQGAFIGGFIWSMSSFVIFLSSGWWNIAGIVAYLPWIILMTLRIMKDDNIKNYIILIILRLMLFYIGSIQYFIYAIFFEILTYLLLVIGFKFQNKNIDYIKMIHKWGYIFLSLLITSIFTLPLLLPMWNHMISSYTRSAQLSYSEFSDLSFSFFDWIKGLLLPFSDNYFNDLELGMERVLPYLSHIGYASLFFLFTGLISLYKKVGWVYRYILISVFTILACLMMTYLIILINKVFPNALTSSFTPFIWTVWKYLPLIFLINFLSYILSFKKTMKSAYSNQLMIFSMTALILSTFTLLWATGMLNPIIFLIPIFNRLRWPFRLNLFVNFYLIILTSIGYSLMMMNRNDIFKKIGFPIALTLLLINFGFLYLSGPPKNFEIFHENIPFTEPHQDELQRGRILSFNIDYEGTPLSNCLCYNYATLWELFHFSGYDHPFILKNNFRSSLNYMVRIRYNNFNSESFPIEYFRIWGVKYYIMKKRQKLFRQVLSDNNCTLAYDEDDRLIYDDPAANPLFHWQESGKSEGIHYHIKTNSIHLSVNNATSDSLIVNFVYHPFFQSYMNHEKTETHYTKFHQISLFIPEGQNEIIIKYVDPYFQIGCYITLIFLIILFLVYIIIKTRHGRMALLSFIPFPFLK